MPCTSMAERESPPAQTPRPRPRTNQTVKVAVDDDGDGIADRVIEGVDVDGDGIPDILTNEEALGPEAKKLVTKYMAGDSRVDREDLILLLQERKKEHESFMTLPFTIIFFLAFALFGLTHEHISDSSMVSREIRGMLEGTTFEGVSQTSGHKTMEDIDVPLDFYNYMKEAVIPLFINPLSANKAQRHRVLRYNELIGGVVLQQVRRQTKNCGSQYPKLGPFSNKDVGAEVNPLLNNFNCYPWDTEETSCFGPPFSGAARQGFCPDSLVFGASTDTSLRRLGEQTANDTRRLDFVPDGGGTGGYSKGKYPAPKNRSYYSLYVFEYEGLETAIEKLNILQNDGWIDYNTAWVGVRFLVLNPTLQIFVHATINVYMVPGGSILPKVVCQSFQPEPYISKAILVLDGFYALCVFYLTIMTLRKMIRACRDEKCVSYFLNGWNWLDLASTFASLGVGALWFTLLSMLDKTKKAAMEAREAEPDPGQTSDVYPTLVAKMHEQLTDTVSYLGTWRLVLCWYTLLISLKFLQSFAAQPRLAVVTETLLRAGVDFIHFFIVITTVFFGYVFAGMLIFGRRLWNWSNMTLAFNEAFLFAMGDADYDELTEEYPMTAGLWYWTFVWLVVILMLNMLMAIVMDVYTEVKGDAASTAPVWIQLQDIAYEYYSIVMGLTVSTPELLKNLEQAPESEFDVPTLMQRIGPGLSEEQALQLIEDARTRLQERTQASITMSDALRILGTLKLKVQGIEGRLAKVLIKEKEEKNHMLSRAEDGKNDDASGAEMEQPPEYYLAETQQKIDLVEVRMDRIESFMQESSNFGSSRQKDLKNRMQTVEDIIRTQRNAVARSTADIWSRPPPKLHDPEFHMI